MICSFGLLLFVLVHPLLLLLLLLLILLYFPDL